MSKSRSPEFNIIVSFYDQEQVFLSITEWIPTYERLVEILNDRLEKTTKNIVKVSCAIHHNGSRKWLKKGSPKWHQDNWQMFYERKSFPTITSKSTEDWNAYINSTT
jgi:hypothetical protein